MKKYVIILLLLVIIIPSVALASWWNPFSWFNNWGKKSEINIQESVDSFDGSEIDKLKKEIEALKILKNNNIVKPVPSQGLTTGSVISNNTENNNSSLKNLNTLQILEGKSNGDKNKISINWSTTLPSESRLIMINDDDKEGVVYESKNGLNTEHSVDISNSQLGWKNPYKITAVTADKKGYDDFYSFFVNNNIDYRFYFGEIDENECQTIIAKDEFGKIITGKELSVHGFYKRTTGGQNYITSRKLINARTNLKGEIKYCEKANFYEIMGVGIKENTTLSK